ncbi:hypothetical protein EZI54_03300 [Marinobacter halodurans]|uniref:Uncharacterized protein n=1 Tax=Marinobacter halodurans TaxID=2528979 RepID=A0ABY1ZNW0_9GAMM|nr:hypothetical protein [Marinobacter halodurans]TBW58425.1 hypothetical protein EZI54_03300 [Marinobacter halodurans]
MRTYIKQSFYFLASNFRPIFSLFLVYLVFLAASDWVHSQLYAALAHKQVLSWGFMIVECAITALAFSSMLQLFEDLRGDGAQPVLRYLNRAPRFFAPLFTLLLALKLAALPLLFWPSWVLMVLIFLAGVKLSFAAFEVVRMKRDVLGALSASWARTQGFMIALVVSSLLAGIGSALFTWLVQLAYVKVVLAGGQAASYDPGVALLVRSVASLSLFFYVIAGVFAYRLYCAAVDARPVG